MIGDVAPEPQVAMLEGPIAAPALPTGGAGVAVSLEKVRVKGGGHTLLDKVSLDIAPGEHVAIVGPSGAGKSTLVGLLLGWSRPVRGVIRVDGVPLDQPAVESLRRMTAWVDPAINLWNESLLDNLRYGNDASRAWSLDAALRGADMLDILEALPEGLQTSLGKEGVWCPVGRGGGASRPRDAALGRAPRHPRRALPRPRPGPARASFSRRPAACGRA